MSQADQIGVVEPSARHVDLARPVQAEGHVMAVPDNAAQLILKNFITYAKDDSWLRGQLKTIVQQLETEQDGINYQDIVSRLRATNQRDAADLVQFMHNRPNATFDEVNEGLGKNLEDGSIRSLVSRSSTALLDIPGCRLSFDTKDSHVNKRITRKDPS